MNKVIELCVDKHEMRVFCYCICITFAVAFSSHSFYSCPKYLLLAYRSEKFDNKCAIVIVFLCNKKVSQKSVPTDLITKATERHRLLL